MASRLLLRPARPTAVALGLTAATTPFFLRPHRTPLRCEASASPMFSSSGASAGRRESATARSARKTLDARTLRQVSTGSIVGLVGGLAVSVLSKPLAVVIGLLVCGNQFLEARGIRLIPYERIQRYVKGVDVKSAVRDNVAFKVAFGATFALAAVAQF